jgi:hypothetical protein
MRCIIYLGIWAAFCLLVRFSEYMHAESESNPPLGTSLTNRESAARKQERARRSYVRLYDYATKCSVLYSGAGRGQPRLIRVKDWEGFTSSTESYTT